MPDYSIASDKRTQATEYVPFWKKEPQENLQNGACHMAFTFNSAFDVAAGRESYRTT